jgi:hypothetical protein
MSASVAVDESGSESLERLTREHPAIASVARFGWIAKGMVYALLGVLAVPIALHPAGQDDGGSGGDQASQTGAVARVAESSFGAAALWAVAVGLALYVAWRVITILLPAENSPKAWVTRIGYGVSAIVYAALAWSAVSFAQGSTSSDPNSSEDAKVERFTRELMSHAGGRWLVGLIGVVVLAIGVFFVARGVTANFRKELDPRGVGPLSSEAIVRLGRIGWIGRGVMMMVVGGFLTRAAWHFRADEAKGIDGSLRSAAGTTVGTAVVLFVALTLIVYGAFCIISAPRQRLRGAA